MNSNDSKWPETAEFIAGLFFIAFLLYLYKNGG